jgi:glycosyltransferase involved in cell wall biosynthesis
LRVTLVVSGYPTRDNPRRGVFNLRARQALSSFADVTVVFLRASAARRRSLGQFSDGNIKVVSVPQLPLRFPFVSRLVLATNVLLYRILGWRAVRDVIRSADVVHSVDAVVGIAVSDWVSRAKKCHVTQVIGTDLNTVLPRMPVVMTGRWHRWLHGVICNSEDLARRFAARYPNVPNVHAIRRGVDVQTFSPDGPALGPQFREGPPRFAFFGGFGKQRLNPAYVKGGPVLLTAWKDGEEALRRSGASLLLSGPDSRSDIVLSWQGSLRYPDRIHLVGEIPPGRMPGYMRATDAIVVPSLLEGLPNVCMEASACGRAVLASNVGGIPEVVVHGETGVLLPAGHVESWTKALVTYSERVDVLREMGLRAQLRMRKCFDSNQYGKRVFRLYEESLSHFGTDMVRA